MILFFSLSVLLVYAGMSVYTGSKLFALVKYFLPAIHAPVFWVLYIFFCFSFIFIWLLFMRFDRMSILRQASLYSFPFIVYFSMGLLLFDLARFILQHFDLIPHSPAFAAAATGTALALGIIVIIYGIFHARNIRTVYYTVNINKKWAGTAEQGGKLRITLASDLHIGATVGRKWVANIVDAVNKTEPDLICLAGDIFDNNIDLVRDAEGVKTELRRLRAPLGVYAVPGNHDIDRIPRREEANNEEAGKDGISDLLKKSGIIFLQDEILLLADSFYLAGRKDIMPIGIKQKRKTAAELTAGLDKSRAIIFLNHQPLDFPMEEKAGADLILAGHTHSGQFFPGNLATAIIFRRAGAVHHGHWQGRCAQGIVSSGAATWGPTVRVGTNSEIAVVDIKFSR